jgi:hypothetical protein
MSDFGQDEERFLCRTARSPAIIGLPCQLQRRLLQNRVTSVSGDPSPDHASRKIELNDAAAGWQRD